MRLEKLLSHTSCLTGDDIPPKLCHHIVKCYSPVLYRDREDVINSLRLVTLCLSV